MGVDWVLARVIYSSMELPSDLLLVDLLVLRLFSPHEGVLNRWLVWLHNMLSLRFLTTGLPGFSLALAFAPTLLSRRIGRQDILSPRTAKHTWIHANLSAARETERLDIAMIHNL